MLHGSKKSSVEPALLGQDSVDPKGRASIGALGRFGLAIILNIPELLAVTASIGLAFSGIAIGWPGIPYAALIVLLSFSLGVISPALSLPLLLLILPIFGNRPGSTQSLYLLLVSSAVATGALLNFLVRGTYLPMTLKLRNPLLFVALLYLIASCLSLVSLPWTSLALDYRARGSAAPDVSLIAFSLWRFFRATEETLEYSILSVAWTGISLTLAYLMVALVNQKKARIFGFSLAILTGLLLSLAFGLLDYYGLIDLRQLRGLDPVVNPGDVQFRLQSFFGHSGWFAEYVTLSIPYGMILLSLGCRFSVRVTMIILLLLAGEFVLILTYQRGGWLSYPLTLFVMWGALYITRQLELGERNFFLAFRKSFVKILVSLPLTVILSLALLSYLSRVKALPLSADLSRYFERAKEIGKSSDRTDFVRAGAMIGALHPILGAGSESFAYQYRKEFRAADGNYAGTLDLPLHGSAHNVYMQTFAGKGIIGLGLLLGILGMLVVTGFRRPIKDAAFSHLEKIVLLCGGTFGVAFLIYGNVQEIFYVQALQFLFFASIGLVAALLPTDSLLRSKWSSVAFSIMGLALFSHLFWELVYPGNGHILKQPETFGCYAAEKDPSGKTFRWCGKEMKQRLPITHRDNHNFVELTLEVHAPGAKESRLSVFFEDAVLINKLVPVGFNSIVVPLDFDPAKSHTEKQIAISIKSSTYFIPARDHKGSQDMRVLSYKLYEPAQS